MPFTIIYGGHADWMDSKHGIKVRTRAHRRRPHRRPPHPPGPSQLVRALHRGGKRNAAVYTVAGGGHQVFLDDAQQFNACFLHAIDHPLPDDTPVRGVSRTYRPLAAPVAAAVAAGGAARAAGGH